MLVDVPLEVFLSLCLALKGGQVTVGRRMYSHARNSLLIQETTDFGLVD